ncbi:hypothetical protein Tco_1393302 [Tanacetum coccineum]
MYSDPKTRGVIFFSQVKSYFWEEPYAFKLCTDNMMRRCVAGTEILKILAHCHLGPTGGHNSASVTSKKYDEDIHDLRSAKIEFPAIAFNDEVSSEKTLFCEPTVSSLNDEIDFIISFHYSDDEDYTSSTYHEFDLKDETSLSECDEEEQNVLYFNDLFPFNVIYLDDSKSDKDNDDDKIDIKHSLGGNVMNTDDGAYAQSTVYTAYSLNEYSVFDTGPRERNIDKYWWRIYKSGDLEVLES